MSPENLHETCKGLLRRAADWRIIGLLFECPREGWADEIAAIARQSADAVLRRSAEVILGEASEGAYLAVLGPGGCVSPREVAYLPAQDPGKILADIAGFYEAWKYRPGISEPFDHVAVEAGFIGYLSLKEAYGCSRGATDETQRASDATRLFLREHLASFAEPLAQRLAATAYVPLVLAGRALLARVGSAPPRVSPPGPEAADCPGACGGIAGHDPP